jgi:ubiquinone/menaquinone biosynthesis C-methylase UbiE
MYDSPFALPSESDELQANFTWRYYYSGEFKFSRRAVRHVRWKRFAAAVSMLRDLPKPTSLVDVGCGPGESTLYISDTFGIERAYGLDISADCVWFANQLARANNAPCQFVVGSAAKLPFGTARADLLLSFETIEHLPHWRTFMREARRVVAPGGCLLISTPNTVSIHTALKSIYRRIKHFDRMNRAWHREGDFYEEFLSDKTLRDGLRDSGFEVLATRHVAFVLTVQPDWTLGAARALEALMERLPGCRRLAVTTLMLARAV